MILDFWMGMMLWGSGLLQLPFTPADVGYMLEESYDIICRTGLHCAPKLFSCLGVPETEWEQRQREFEEWLEGLGGCEASSCQDW